MGQPASIGACYQQIFSVLGFETESASNSRNGLEKACSSHPDFILLDVSGQVITARDYAERLNLISDEMVKATPFIILAGNTCIYSIREEIKQNPLCKGIIPDHPSPHLIAMIVEEIIKGYK